MHYRIFKINNLFLHKIFHWRYLLIGRCRAQRHSSMLPWSSSKFSTLTWKEILGDQYREVICCTKLHENSRSHYFTHFSVNSIWELSFVSVALHMACKFDYIRVSTIGQFHEEIKSILMKVENYLYFHILHQVKMESEIIYTNSAFFEFRELHLNK